MPPSSPTPKSRPDTHLPHRGRGGRTVGGRAPHPVISSGKCSQTKSREDARPSAAGRTAVWPVRLRVTWGRGVSGGATRKPRDESGQARAAPPPASRRGRGDSTVFPVFPPPAPGVRASSSAAWNPAPASRGFCVSEGEDTEMGETTGRGAPSVQRGEQSGNFHSRKTSATSLPSHGGLGAGEQGRGPWAPTADTY